MKVRHRANRDKAHRTAARGHRKATRPAQRRQVFFTGGQCRY